MLGAGAYGLAWLLARSPGLVEAAYTSGIWPRISRPISLASGSVPFMVGELLIAAYLLWVLTLGVLAVRSMARKQRSAGNALAGGARRVLRDGGIVVLLFYVVWGGNFARAPFEQRVAWPVWKDATEEELTRLAREAVEAANEAYLALHGSQDAGEPTTFPEDVRGFEAAIDEGWARAASKLDLPEASGLRYGPVKRPLASGLLPRFGISGVYFPFTGEANVPRGLPAVAAAHTMAHEKAHQRGVANEAEANFLGFVAGSLAPHPLSRYGAAVFAQGQLLNALRSRFPEAYRELRARRLPGIQRDLEDLVAYYARYRGVGQTIGGAVNDRFLRVNRVPGGIESYGRSVRLVIELARQTGGGAMPEWSPSTPASEARPSARGG